MRSTLTLAAAIAVAVTTVGCTSGPGVVRGQSPQYGPQNAAYSAPAGTPQTIQQTGGHHRGIRATPIYDATLAPHLEQDTAFFDGHSGMGATEFPVGACPTGGYPSGACPPGTCSPLHPKFIRDARSYSYSQPDDLVYPNANAVGGAVVYPHYTHKGPSDFFRQ